jgi:cystathionine beta-lyase/cystathionine gamma-synthase
MTHASLDEDARAVTGINEGLLRLSVGIEDATDLVTDLRVALMRAEEVAYAVA